MKVPMSFIIDRYLYSSAEGEWVLVLRATADTGETRNRYLGSFYSPDDAEYEPLPSRELIEDFCKDILEEFPGAEVHSCV